LLDGIELARGVARGLDLRAAGIDQHDVPVALAVAIVRHCDLDLCADRHSDLAAHGSSDHVPQLLLGHSLKFCH
jgi:hypothetical protein